MKFLFATLQTYESEFYGDVQRELERRGHQTLQVTVSRAAAHDLRAAGLNAICLHDVEHELPPADVAVETARLEAAYPVPHLRDVYRGDLAVAELDEDALQLRAVNAFRALEQIFDDFQPDVACPEVGNETIRVAAHLVAMGRDVPSLFLLFTPFPRPLRVVVDTLHGPIVPQSDVRELTAAERDEVDSFISDFTQRAQPIRAFRRWPVEWRRVRLFAGHVRRKRSIDRDNEYLRPLRLLWMNVSETLRARVARPFYDSIDETRPFVYFPLHVTDDYKIKRIIPHCVDQASIIEQIADALPSGYDLVLKEHPMSVGRNSIVLLRRLRKRRNVRLVAPYSSTHELIQRAAAVAVISSTVGLEALFYDAPVLTLGEPYYAGYGVTLDLSSFGEIRDGVPQLLRYRPDPELIRRVLHAMMRACFPGKPLLVDRSDANALAVADTIDRAAQQAVAARARGERVVALAP